MGYYQKPFRESPADRYCRLLPPLTLPTNLDRYCNALRLLGQAMLDDGSRVSEERPEILMDCGYTYFGQLMAHDLTMDTSSVDDSWKKSPEELENRQTPRLDLNVLYGAGPDSSAELYEDDGVRLKIGASNSFGKPFDVCVNGKGDRVLADERSGANLILRQMTAVFARFHNLAVDQFEPVIVDRRKLFERAKLQMRWQFQWLVLKDYLPAVLNPRIYRDTFVERRPRMRWRRFSIPIEFAAAAMRFGHAMVRPNYLFGYGRDTMLPKIFGRTSEPGALDEQFQINWGFFFQGAGEGGAVTARPIDTRLSWPLHQLPIDLIGAAQIACPHFRIAKNPDQLAVRTLLRGAGLRLASGQSAARALGNNGLSESELTRNSSGEETDQGEILRRTGLTNETPLWYWILKESEVRENGNRLGPVGSRVIGETIYGALVSDPDSIIHQSRAQMSPPIWNFPDGPTRIYGLSEFFRRSAQV